MASKEITLMTLRLEVEKWLESIPNGLRERVRDNYVLAGGAIVSTVLDKPINDYDIWITDQLVLVDLLNHYLTQISPILGSWTAELDFETNVRIRSNILNSYESGFYLYKINESNIKTLSHFSLTLWNNFQIIFGRTAPNARALVRTFDFEHNKVYITNNDTNLDSITTQIIYDPELVYTGSKHPVSSLVRVAKHLEKGKKVTAETLAKIAKDIISLSPEQQKAEVSLITADSQGLTVTVSN